MAHKISEQVFEVKEKPWHGLESLWKLRNEFYTWVWEEVNKRSKNFWELEEKNEKLL